MATRKASNNRISPQASQASGPSSQPYSAASSSDIPPDGLSGRLGSANAPRLSFQEAALGEGARSAGLRSSTSWSFMRNRGSHEQSSDLDNWQTLQDLVGKQDEDLSEGRKLLGHPSHKRSRTFNLTTVFSSTGREEESSSPTVRVLERNAERDAEAEVPLSASPPQLDGLYGVDVHEDEDERGEPPNGINGLNGHTLEDGEDDPRDSPIPFLAENHRSSTQTSLKGSTGSRYWPPSPVAIAILKCAIAYLIASLFTFVPALSNILSTSSETDAHGRITRRPAYSAHMVATIVVYFNPAKTVGNMLLATRFCIILALLATLVSLLSMATVHVFDHFAPSEGFDSNWISEIGDWIVCIVWIGGSMGWLAWAKVWVANPSFNSGCSMAAVTLYTVIIKEGNLHKLLEVLLIVLIGAGIANIVCYTIFPTSATSRLQSSITKSLSSFSTLFDLLTSTFLLDKTVVRGNRTNLKEAVQSHAKAFKTLKSDLGEAKYERVLDPRIRGRRLDLYEAAIGSLTRLAQHLAGLRSSTRLQESLIRAIREGQIDADVEPKEDFSAIFISFLQRDTTSSCPAMLGTDIAGSIRLFLQFRDIAGAQMDTLVSRCDDALEAVQGVAQQSPKTDVALSTTRTALASSLEDFTQCSSRAIKRLYAGPRRERGIYERSDSDSDSGGDAGEPPSDLDGMAERPNETVFLIDFFLFTLEEFGREMIFLLDTMKEISTSRDVSTWEHIRSWWPSQRDAEGKKVKFLYKQLRQVVPIDPSHLQPPPFPRNRPDDPDNLLHSHGHHMSASAKLRQRFWEFGATLRQPDMRYAVKTGLAGAPAFTEWGRPVFLAYRGEWALIAYFATMSPTVGQTNFLSFFRVVGTILGAAVAVLFYTVFPHNEIVLPILGFFFSMPCFYIITQMPEYAQAGRFILLTYNLTCLYAYNQRDRDVAVLDIAFHRSTSVIIGVIWAAIVSRYWWPFTARRELRIGISDFCVDLSYLYSKLVTTYSRGVDSSETTQEGPEEQEPLLPLSQARLPHLSHGVRQFMAMELHLQSQLVELRDLLGQTKNEPRLKGPFAFGFYKEVLLSCERIVDRLHSMRCVTARDEWDNGMRKAFVEPVNKQRREMAGNVILYFYTLSAGFRLRTPMPYLPPAEHARQRLVEAIRDLDMVKRRSVRGGGRHLLLFAYALAMQEVIAELEHLGGMLQDAFGVISQSTVIDFEALFQKPPSSAQGD